MRTFLVIATLTVCGLVLMSPWASERPDGLEHAIEQRAYVDAHEESQAPGWALFPDYGWRSGSGGTVTAGLTGAGIVLALGWALGHTRTRRGRRSSEGQ